jgi:hypothetical protein
MAESCSYQIRRFDLNTDTYTPIVAPCDCNYFFVTNSDGTKMLECSDTENQDSWCEVPANDWFSVSAPRTGPVRFRAGEIVTYLKATTGVGPAIAKFVL